jgi:glycosyltransferase involved in cell wall biosynthesis
VGTPRHILLLVDRDWDHPDGDPTRAGLQEQVRHWIARGHRVTVICSAFPGGRKVEQPHDRLTIHRVGGPRTVWARAALACARGVGRDADVVLEVVDGVAFATPLWWWLKAPRVTLVPQLHQERRIAELGARGALLAFATERGPLRFLYRHHPFLTVSKAAADDLVALGIPREQIHVHYPGVEARAFPPATRTGHPSLVHVGPLESHKKLDTLLDVLEAVPSAHLDLAGDGPHRHALETEIAGRGLGDRVTVHGHVGDERKAELYGRSWLNLPAPTAEA